VTSRLTYLARQPKRTLAALALAAAATAVAVGSGASFSATAANPSNTFATGSLSISNSKDGVAVLTAANMKPGDPATTGTVDVQNSGTTSGAFTLSRGAVADSDAANPLTGKLDLVVKDCGDFSSGTPTCDAADPTVYSGTVAAMGTVALGTFAGGVKHRYEFDVQLNASADDNYQSDDASAQFDWNAA
jgi:spore coat-associated protein N